MKNKIQCIFVWRLTVEKWFDLVLELIQKISWTDLEDKIHIHIFGDGVLKDYISQQWFTTYHWYQAKDLIFETRKKCHYCLMPSKFLETFGLTALDSLSVWVPIVWFKKWWLSQFGEWILDMSSWWLYPDVKSLIDTFDQTQYDSLSKECLKIAKKYSWQTRKEQFEKHLWKPIQGAKILLISDYTNNIWGIESYIHTVTDKLQDYGATTVSVVWGDFGSKKLSRYLWLLFSPYNLIIKNRIKKLLKINNYDLIRWQSVQRFIWPYPIHYVSKNTTSKQWIMTHDFGIYHPFPSQIYSETQLIDSNSFLERMKAGFKSVWWSLPKKILRSIPLFLKYWSSHKLKNQIQKNMDIILVPSEYMKKNIQTQYGTTTDVQTLSHVI